MFISIRENREDVVLELLNIGFDVNATNNDGERPIDIAWKLNSFELAFKFLLRNSAFPKKYQPSENIEVQKFLNKCEDLHKDVKNGDIEKLKEKEDSYKNLRYVFNGQNVSLLANAIKLQQIDIITFLTSKGMSTGIHEDITFNVIDNKDLSILSIANQNNSFESPENYISIILSRCRIAKSVSNQQVYWECISEAFIKINTKFPLVLKFAAEIKTMKIFFDFNNNYLHNFDPAQSENTQSMAYHSGIIEIAAKGLLDETRKFGVIGSLIHEMYHLVMDWTYRNNFNPYPVGWSEEEHLFIYHVSDECKHKAKFEDCIKKIFLCYPERDKNSELITAVVQMTMKYFNNPERLDKVKMNFRELFWYHENFVEPVLEATLPIIKILNDTEKEVKFENLTKSWKAKILHTNIDIQGKKSTFDDLIGDDSKVLRLLTSENIRDMLLNGKSLEILKPTVDEKEEGKIIERKFVDFHTVARDVKHKVSIEDFLESKNILLADYPGSGKTKTFSMLIKNFKNIPKHFAFLISLQNQREVFESSEKFRKGLEINNVVKILISLLKLKVELEIEIFRALFQQNKIVLLFDGFDKIDSYNIDFFTEILQKIDKETENKIWITTRLAYVDLIKGSLNVDVYKHVAFTIKEKNQLFKGKYYI